MKKFVFLIIFAALHIFPKISAAGNIQIEFTEDETYSIEVARINVGDTIEWLPKNEGHNVEFLASPLVDSLPPKSEIDERHTVMFTVPGIYLYGCTPHANMGMLGLIVVGNDLHNIESIEKTDLSPLAASVLKRLIRIAKSVSN